MRDEIAQTALRVGVDGTRRSGTGIAPRKEGLSE